jgi:hypothetical protein
VSGQDPLAVRRQLEDAWAEPLVQQRWQRLALRLGASGCEHLVRRAAQQGLARGGWQWLDTAQATDGWGPDTTLPLVRHLRPVAGPRATGGLESSGRKSSFNQTEMPAQHP